MTGECFLCDAPATRPFGRGYLCDGCVPDGSTIESRDTDDTSFADSRGGDDAWRVESGLYLSDLQDVDQWLVWKPTEDGRKIPRTPCSSGRTHSDGIR